jgi:hypothetical protein
VTTSPDDVLDTLAMVRVLYDDNTEPATRTHELLDEWQELDADGVDGSGLMPTMGIVLHALLRHTQPDVDSMFAEAHIDALAAVA